MKKTSKLGKLFALLLAVVMVVSMVPASVYAVLGDRYTGTTNVQNNAFDASKTPVSLPIKIYDYLNDGMLFDFAEVGMEGQYMGGYAGGVAAPYSGTSTGATMQLIGTDYTGANRSSTRSDGTTIGDPFQLYATRNLMNANAYGTDYWNSDHVFNGQHVSYTHVGAVDNVTPQYLNLRHDQASGRGFSWVSNFARDDKQYYAKKDVRYAVIVYRTNDAYMGTGAANGATDSSHVLSWYWTISFDKYATDYTYHTSSYGGIDISRNDTRYSNSGNDVAIPKSTNWTYAVVDMRKGNIDTNWDYSTTGRCDVTGIGFGFPLVNEGEEMDISHIYYFETEDEAEAFGIQAVQFDKDPGIDLSKEYYGGASAPVVDIGLDFTNDRDLNGNGKTGCNSYSVQTNWVVGAQLTFKRHTLGQLRYGQATNSDTAVPDVGTLVHFVNDDGQAYPLWKVRYCVIVYHTGSKLGNNAQIQLGLNRYNDNLSQAYTLQTTGSTWTYVVVDMLTGYNATAGHSHSAGINTIGIKWPGFNGTSQFLNMSHIAFFDNSADATAFGAAAAAFDNNPGTYVSGGRGWNMGSNRAYGLLRGSHGGGFTQTSVTGADRLVYNTSSTYANAYYSPTIGYNSDKTNNSANKIYHVNMFSYDDPSFNTKDLNFDGYSLISTVFSNSLATMGMLEASLSPSGKPVYRQETIEYVATLLCDTLVIPEVNKRECFRDNLSGFDKFVNNFYNYNYVKGTPDASKYGTTTDGEPRDLAQALRDSLETETGRNPGYTYIYKIMYKLGNYADTLTKAEAGQLTGSFLTVQPNIKTCYDAAYYILNNLFVGNSYNTAKTDYSYLLLQPATVTSSDGSTTDAFVFDAGFTNGSGVDAESGVKYDTTNKTITNFVTDGNSLGKTMYDYSRGSLTTFYPFLPITDTNNEAGMTMSPYFQEPGASGTDGAGQYYANRNFNYVLSANGEFTYREDDNLFFEFEGDDDVYLFVNGQLVLDIGAAHSITTVRVNINDYVNAARAKIAAGTATDRDRALALDDGSSYDFDFFYMERHGYGANMRIVTNMRVTNSDMQTEKTAYQNDTQINYGGIVNSAQTIEYGFAISNTGSNTLYNLSFEDKDIGLSLTSEDGFQKTGGSLYDKDGNSLEVTDLVAYVEGYSDWYEATQNGTDPTQKTNPITVTFANNDALKAFLKNLQATGTSSEAGGGLWPYAKVTIRGVYYKLTEDQITDKKFNNTLDTAANTQADGQGSILRGEASMLVMLPGDLVYYQWDETYLAVGLDKLATDIRAAAATTLDSSLASITSITDVQIVTSSGTSITNLPTSNVYYNVKGHSDTDPGVEMPRFPGFYYAANTLNIQYTTPGTYVFYIKVTYNTASATGKISGAIPVLANVTHVNHHNYVLDYGLKVDLTEGNDLTKNDYISIPGRDNSSQCLGISALTPHFVANENRITFTKDEDGVVDSSSGQFVMSGSTLTYTPSRFMDTVDLLYVAYNVYENDVNGTGTPSAVGGALDINNEVQMIKEVRVLPANVVYYEDDFVSIDYNPDNASTNVFTPIGGSGELYQQADREQEYGKDNAYKNNSEMSGNSLHKIQIKDKAVSAKFTFKGTGLELISRTNAYDSALIMMTVKDQSGNEVKSIPVVTQFDNDNGSNTDEIYQVPVIRIKDLPYDTYTVEIKGFPTYDFSNGVQNPVMKTTYLYLDGIRIYDPMGGSGDNYYNAAEQGATFQEIRDLIVEGIAAVSTYDGNQMTVSTGTVTWTENLLGTNYDGSEYIGNTVSSVDDYLAAGPNNEVYVDGTTDNTALVFYVNKNAGVAVNALQIGIRALDRNLFYATSGGTAQNSAVIMLGVKDGSSVAWKELITVTSSTEQYYTIDLNQCPVDSNGRIQVALKVESGLACFTSLKHSGVELVRIHQESSATLTYQNGFLVKKNTDEAGTITYSEVESANYIEYQLLGAQMRAETVSDSTEEAKPVIPTITPAFPTVALEDEIKYNIYFSATDLDSVEEMGLAAFDTKLTEGTIADAGQVFSGYVVDGDYYMVQTDGIPAKDMGDTMYFRIYAKLTDGSYVYSTMFHFSAVDYVKSVLNSDAYAVGLKQTCVALMNYGAEAQTHFGYNTDSLMNSFLTDEQKATIGGYSPDMVSPIVKADAAKVGEFAAVSGGFEGISPSVSLEGAFAINYYFDPANTVAGEMQFYCWDAEAYNSADVLTVENAVSVTTVEEVNGQYCATVSGIAARELDDTVYVAAVYECDGVRYCSGVLAVSVSALCKNQMSTDAAMTALAESMIVYGSYAKSYFVK